MSNNIDLTYTSNLSYTNLLIKIINKPLQLKRQTHLYCKKCSACQSEYGNFCCDNCGAEMLLKNRSYVYKS